MAGHRFSEGTWALLDLYGTNRDDRLRGDPEAVRPVRFAHRQHVGPADAGPFPLIAQGGGAHDPDHLCAGEGLTLGLKQLAARLLATAMRYDVPARVLRADLSRLSAAPRSRFVIGNVTPAP